ncbi:MAG: LLM class flavin-dependent oxidoreductase [Mycobacteriales bacterium]
MVGSRVSFGLTLPQRGVFFGIGSLADMVSMARDADRSSLFDSVWVGDSLTLTSRPDSVALLGGLATATERLKLGVGCMATFPVRDPLVFAYQWASLDLLSQGRMLLATCTGLANASASEGAHWSVTDAERPARLAENIEICRRLWDVTFEGKFRSFKNVTIEPRPVQQPCPIWIAANPRKAPFIDGVMRRVASKADGWMCVQLYPKMFASLCEKLREFLDQEQRDPASFPNIAYYNINIAPDRQTALTETQKFLDQYYGPHFSPDMVEAWTAAGTPEQCIERLRELKRDGAKSITLRITSWQQAEQYRRLVNEVLPHVNAEG